MYGTQKRKPTIALDYDDTIDKLPLFFKQMVSDWKHAIDFHVVTYRSQNTYDDLLREFEELTEHKIVFTDAKAKRDNFSADIWIDDRPISITHDFTDYGFVPSKTTKSLYLKSHKCFTHNGVTKCHNQITKEEIKRFTFCPYCGGKLIK